MSDKIIPAYLYQQYSDDENLRAFIDTYNSLAQKIYDWLKNANLAVYAGNGHAGQQLRWLLKGLYGADAPILMNRRQRSYGAYNALAFNQFAVNAWDVVTSDSEVETSDDLFKRVMTWNFYKGDGFHFTIPWLKRRVLRFLTGVNGADVVNDQRWSVSVLFSDAGAAVSIINGYRELTETAMFNTSEYNSRSFNEAKSTLYKANSYGYATLFKQAFEGGILHMPFYQPVSVTVVG